MKLFELAYASRLYRGEFDYSYDRMCKCLGPNPDLLSGDQRDCLLRFLNDWRCRIPENRFPTLSNRLLEWATQWVVQLPDNNRDIRSLNEKERATVGYAFEAMQKFGTGLHFKNTAAAKTLHAIRRNLLPMWDAAIRDRFISDHVLSERTAGQIYSEFICYVGEELSELERDVARLGYSLSDVSRLVHGAGASLVKLVDEYHWVTITEGLVPPSRNDLEDWLHWII